MTAPTSLIINSAFVEPQQYWAENTDRTLRLEPKRRPAGYEIIDTRENTRRQVAIPLVDDIRQRVNQWRADGWPGVTAITLELLTHWWDLDKVSSRQYPFYFCQLEAIETLIWYTEAQPEYRQGLSVQGDGGAFERLCNKMATGSGKTTVMAMIITWQVLNALTYPKSPRKYSSAVFLVAPGLTVKSRLQVLLPGHLENYYDSFELCPSEALRQKLNRAEVLIENWHTLMPLKAQERSVVKKGKESDEAFTKRVLGKLATYKDLVVINDEAHHAYRTPADVKISKAEAEALGIDLDEATRWVEGLDRIHKTRRIARCFDLSATPFAPTGRTNTEAGLFTWVVSDFGLNDAIEAGLVKTPRVVVRDDAMPNAQTLRSKLYHLYREPEVAEDLNRKAEAHEPLPALVQQAYTLLGADWRATAAEWAALGHLSPPVMLTVCNRTETAARVEHYFAKGGAQWPELHNAARTFRVDSKVLEKAELGETATADKDYELRLKEIMEAARIPEDRKEALRAMKKEELLRELVDTVGKRDQAGQDLQNVVSVAMLSEGYRPGQAAPGHGSLAHRHQRPADAAWYSGNQQRGHVPQPVASLGGRRTSPLTLFGVCKVSQCARLGFAPRRCARGVGQCCASVRVCAGAQIGCPARCASCWRLPPASSAVVPVTLPTEGRFAPRAGQPTPLLMGTRRSVVSVSWQGGVPPCQSIGLRLAVASCWKRGCQQRDHAALFKSCLG
jgi:type III restriction enzyme